jgi:hypothetical protein
LFVVANLTFYLWETGVGREKPRFDRVEITLPDETDRIVLIKELPAIPRRSPAAAAKTSKGEAIPEQAVMGLDSTAQVESKAAPEQTAQASPQPADPHCFRLGPYRAEALARAALESIGERVPGGQLVPGLAEAVTGYWVLYPKAETIDAAKINRRMLMSKGITELWMFDKGELAGAISLGLYQTVERAEIAQKRFFEQNLKVEVVPRVSRSPAIWVQLHWEGERDELEGIVAGIPGKNQGPQSAQLKGCD